MDLKKLGRFEIIDEIGSGGMGIVYKGRDPRINRMVALKVIRTIMTSKKSEDQEQAMDRFYIEAQAAGALSHQSIVTIYDVGEETTKEGNIVYIAMEFIEGNGLDYHIIHQTYDKFEDKLKILRAIAEGLDYAHKRDITHRDVKPANIIMTEDNQPKLTDFGLARFSDSSLTMSGTILGTPNYMSPEQVQGKKVDARSDFFALTVILYEMLTGEKPFAGDSITTVIYRVVNEEPIPPTRLDASLPPSVDHFINKGMAKAPSKRFQNGKEFIAAIDALIAGRNIPTDSSETLNVHKSKVGVTPIKSSEGGEGMSKGLIAGIAGAAIILIILAVVFMGGGKDTRVASAPPVEEPRTFQEPEPAPPVAEPVPDIPPETAPVAESDLIPGPTSPEPAEPASPPAEEPKEAKKEEPVKKEEPKKPALKPEMKPVKKKAEKPKVKKKKTVKKKKKEPTEPGAMGFLTVESDPKNAEVFIDRKFLGLTPINKLLFKQGEHNLRVLKKGYRTYEKKITLTKRNAFKVALVKGSRKSEPAAPGGEESGAPAPNTGGLNIFVPPNSIIYVDGREFKQEEVKLENLSPGSHIVYIQVKGKSPHNARLNIKAGETETIDLR